MSFPASHIPLHFLLLYQWKNFRGLIFKIVAKEIAIKQTNTHKNTPGASYGISGADGHNFVNVSLPTPTVY